MPAIPPIIVIGMHRSGTTLLTNLLRGADLFMGVDRDRNEEARFTRDVNNWFFRQSSASWDRPAPIDDLLSDKLLRPSLVDYVDGITRGPASIRFLGVTRYGRWRGLDRIPGPWGWKDPCNTFTLPLWMEIFPDARVIHIVRHGVDVAASLKARRERVVDENLKRYQRWKRLYQASPRAPKRRGFGPQPRCGTLEGGLELWEEYIARGRRHVMELGPQALEVSYESLLTTPKATVAEILAFANAEADAETVIGSTKGIAPERANSWRNDPGLRRFAGAVDSRLRRYGYEGCEP